MKVPMPGDRVRLPHVPDALWTVCSVPKISTIREYGAFVHVSGRYCGVRDWGAYYRLECFRFDGWVLSGDGPARLWQIVQRPKEDEEREAMEAHRTRQDRMGYVPRRLKAVKLVP